MYQRKILNSLSTSISFIINVGRASWGVTSVSSEVPLSGAHMSAGLSKMLILRSRIHSSCGLHSPCTAEPIFCSIIMTQTQLTNYKCTEDAHDQEVHVTVKADMT